MTKTTEKSTFSDKVFVVGIGAQRAGTTWLAAYFDSHPDVFMSPIKEMHYFSNKYSDKRKKYNKKYNNNLIKYMLEWKEDSYRADSVVSPKIPEMLERVLMTFDDVSNEKYKLFFETRIRAEKAFCEITPAYAALTSNVFSEIYGAHNHVRFIFQMRDPVERHCSALRHYSRFRKDFDISKDFDKSLLDDEYAVRGDYRRTIENLERVVPKENIHYMFYETLFMDETIANLCDDLGICQHQANFDQKKNTGEYVPITDEMKSKIFQKYKDVYDYIWKKFGQGVPPFWQNQAREFSKAYRSVE